MTAENKPQNNAHKVWLLPIGVISTLLLLLASLLAYLGPTFEQKEPTLIPFYVGIAIFAALMIILTYQAMAKEWKGRIFTTVLIVMVETALFAYCLFLVISNFRPMNGSLPL